MTKAVNLHSLNFDEITFEDVESFCKQKVIENVQLDYKEILPSGLSKHLASFSNTKGGIIIVGVAEDPSTGEPKSWKGIKKEGKLIDQVFQHAGNVIPYPTIKVRFTDEKSGKAFLLIQIVEGGTPPYHTVSDPTIWIRTGNVSTPLDRIRQDDLDRLYQKKEKATEVRDANSQRVLDIYLASLERAKEERDREFAASPDSGIYDKSFEEFSTVLSIEIQPFFPEKEIATRQETKARISDYRVTGTYADFPNLAAEQCPGGISYFNWARHSGHFESQIVLGNGIVLSARDIRDVHDGKPILSLTVLTGLIARQMKAASNFYKLFGYTGVLSGRVTVTNMKGVHVYDLRPSGYTSWFEDGHQITKISDDSWVIKDLDTHKLGDRDGFYKILKSVVDEIFWDLGMPVPDDAKLSSFLDKDLRYFPLPQKN